jgi:hypothetical protein
MTPQMLQITVFMARTRLEFHPKIKRVWRR